jgi:hypothetical protein
MKTHTAIILLAGLAIFSPYVGATNISGGITGTSGIASVSMKLTGNTTQTTLSSSTGYYKFLSLAHGTYIITPKKYGFAYTPTSKTLTLSSTSVGNVNFAAKVNRFALYGTVTGAVNPVTVTLSGSASATTTTATNGTYRFTNLLDGRSYTLTPSQTSYTFAPVSRTLTLAGANVTGLDFVGSPGAPAAPTITTTTLSNGMVSQSYSGTLAATGGTQPYSWNVSAGALPTGLTLSTAGAISGTPTTAGAFDFTARVLDSASQSDTQALRITVDPSSPPPSSVSFWQPSAVPGLTSAPGTDPVTVGLQFYSEVAGNVTGIRFYKGTGNTGTHVANLWSATGQSLASATFTGETTTGWQQVNFTTPYTITPNTSYVISYFTPTGHFAHDQYYDWASLFAAPLHVFTSSPGVFHYGTVAGFPNESFNVSNYWVDLVFVPSTTSSNTYNVNLNWVASTTTDVTGYRVYRGTASGGPYTQIAQVTGLTAVDSMVTNGTTYFYVAKAFNSTAESIASNQFSAIIPML